MQSIQTLWQGGSIIVKAILVCVLIFGPLVSEVKAAPTSATWTLTEDFTNNAVVGPDLEFGTGDDGSDASATSASNAHTLGDAASLRAIEYLSAKAGDYYTTAGLKADGTMWVAGDTFTSAGDPTLDQLCQGSTYPYLNEMTQIGTDTDWVYFNAGFDTLHMIKSDGTLWGCGEAGGGQLGDGTTVSKNVPTQIGTDTNWEAVWGADWHTIGKKTDGTLWAWGADWCGNLGQGTEDEQKNSPVQIGTDNDWDKVSAGDTHNLATKTDGTLWSWGCDYTPGELGLGNNPDYAIEVPTQVGTDTDWADVAAGFMRSAAIKTDGTLWTFGDNSLQYAGDPSGTLGHNNLLDINVPTQVGTDTDWEEVSVGFYHFMAKKTDGTLWGWGDNADGATGVGYACACVIGVPTQAGTDDDWETVSAGDSYSIALKTDGSMWAVGSNSRAQVPTGDLLDKHEFTEIYYPPYHTTGTLSGLKVYAGAGNTADWTGLDWTSEALPADTEIRFRVRTSDDDLTYSAWSSYFTQDLDASTTGTADLSSITDAAYLELEVSFTTVDELVTPELLDFTLDYDPEAGVGGGATAPTLTTAAATAVGETTVTLNGEITAIGSQAPTSRGFEYGLDNTYGTTASEAGTFAAGTFTEDLTGLTCNTTYHFRAFATSPDGTGTGSDQTFTTTACAAPAPSGGGSSSGSTSNPFEPIITPILPVIPVPVVPVEETEPVFNCIAEPCDGNQTPEIKPLAEEPVKETEPVFNCIAEPCEQVPTEEPTTNPVVPGNTSDRSGTSTGMGLRDQVSGWFGSGADLIPLNTLSSTGLVVLAALLPLAISASTLSVATAGIPLGLSGFQLLYSRYFQDLLSFLGLRKKRRVWGTVYDSQTKQPLDPAVVELIDAQTGEVVERAITDLAGRFGFLARQGNFLLQASKTHYAFPSQKETGSTDEIFDNLYHGEQLELTEGSTLVAPNIPMDPIGFDWNQEAKQKLLPSRLRLHYLVQVVFNAVFVAGFAFSIYNVANYGGLWNTVSLGLYVFILMLRLLMGHKHLWGRITKNGQPLANTKLELIHPQFNVIMGKALSSVDGKFFIKTPEPGFYKLTVRSIDGQELLSSRPVEVGRDSVLNSEINL